MTNQQFISILRSPLVRVVVGFVFIIGLAFTAVSTVLLFSQLTWDRRAKQVTGEVIELKTASTTQMHRRAGTLSGPPGKSLTGSQRTKKATVVYRIDGKEYRTKTRISSKSSPSIGGSMQLQYLPDQPGKARMRRAKTQGYMISLASLAVGCTILIIGSRFLWLSLRPNASLH